MRFEHLIEINNFDDPRTDILVRDDLWAGLLLRIKEPTLFIEHMDSASVNAIDSVSFSRTLNYGKFTVSDTVKIFPQEKIIFTIPSQGEIIASTLTITIEEPFHNRFFLRFLYEDDALDTGPEAMYNDFKRSAYKAADIDFVRIIRQLSAQGLLDNSKPRLPS